MRIDTRTHLILDLVEVELGGASVGATAEGAVVTDVSSIRSRNP